MPNPTSSPSRNSSKATPSERDKRKSSENLKQDATVVETGSVKSTKKHKKALSTMEPPDSPPAKVDFSRPRPPVSKTASQAGSVKSMASKAKQLRAQASTASLKANRPGPDESQSVSSAKKPSSSISQKPPSMIMKHAAAVSDSEMDDGTSVAESFSGIGRVRRTEAERIEYFKNQPECDSNIEPDRVRCLRCNKEVKLGNKTKYNVRPWEKHRVVCDQKVPPSMFENNKTGLSEDQTSTASTRKTLEERKAVLTADPNALEVKPDEVLCKRCQKWIRLNKTYPYALSNWEIHQNNCTGAIPSDRVAAAERKLRIVNDADAKSFGPHNVVCKHCGINIPLEGKGEYNLGKWDTHKSNCPRHPSSSGPPVTAAPASSPSSRRGTKRSREEAELDEDSEVAQAMPEANKPRTDSYTPAEQASGPFGWFLIPFKAFVSGFKESLRSEAAS